MNYAIKISALILRLKKYIQYLNLDIAPSVLESYEMSLRSMRDLPPASQAPIYEKMVSELAPLVRECQSAVASSLYDDISSLEEMSPSGSIHPFLRELYGGPKGNAMGNGMTMGMGKSVSSASPTGSRTVTQGEGTASPSSVCGSCGGESPAVRGCDRVGHPDRMGDAGHDCRDGDSPIDRSDHMGGETIEDKDREGEDAVDFWKRHREDIPEDMKAVESAVASLHHPHECVRVNNNGKRTGAVRAGGKNRLPYAERDDTRTPEQLEADLATKPMAVYSYLDHLGSDAMYYLMKELLAPTRSLRNGYPLLMQWFRSRKRLYSVINLSEPDGRYMTGGIPFDLPGAPSEKYAHAFSWRRYRTYRREEIDSVMQTLFGHGMDWEGYRHMNERDVRDWNREFNSCTYEEDGTDDLGSARREISRGRNDTRLMSHGRRYILSRRQITDHAQAMLYMRRAERECTSLRYLDYSGISGKYSDMDRDAYASLLFSERLDSLNALFVPQELRLPLSFVATRDDRLSPADRRTLIADLALLSMDDRASTFVDMPEHDLIDLYHTCEEHTEVLVDAIDSLPKKNVIALYYRLLCMAVDGRMTQLAQKRYASINNRCVRFDNAVLTAVSSATDGQNTEMFVSAYRLCMGAFANAYARRHLRLGSDIVTVTLAPRPDRASGTEGTEGAEDTDTYARTLAQDRAIAERMADLACSVANPHLFSFSFPSDGNADADTPADDGTTGNAEGAKVDDALLERLGSSGDISVVGEDTDILSSVMPHDDDCDGDTDADDAYDGPGPDADTPTGSDDSVRDRLLDFVESFAHDYLLLYRTIVTGGYVSAMTANIRNRFNDLSDRIISALDETRHLRLSTSDTTALRYDSGRRLFPKARPATDDRLRGLGINSHRRAFSEEDILNGVPSPDDTDAATPAPSGDDDPLSH